MNDLPVVDAMLVVLTRRSTMQEQMIRRLSQALRADGVRDLTMAHDWVASCPRLDQRLRAFLARVLAPRDMPPFGDFVPLCHLADGGMGRVWLCGAPDDHLVVVKTIHAEHGGDSDFMARFAREAHITCALRSPHIVAALGHGFTDDHDGWLALEYITGGDLKQLLKRRGRLDESEALLLVYQIGMALVDAHAHHLVHRDIKPANIFLDVDQQAKLGDFGCARSTQDDRTMLTMEGTTLGTPAYMSPEQIRAEAQIDIRSDIYALGVLLYAMLTGEEPYQGNTSAVLRQHLQARPPDARRLVPHLHERSAKTVLKCMLKKPEHRFRDPAALCKSLRRTLDILGVDPDRSLDGSTITDAFVSGGEVVGAIEELHDTAPIVEARPAPATSAPAAQTDVCPTPTVATGHDPSGLDDEATLVDQGVGATDDSEMTLNDQSDASALPEHLERSSDQPWLCLLGHGVHIHLWARPALLVGKQRSAPVDYPARVYPLDEHRERCQRISRQHCTIGLDAGNSVVITDHGSGNGTMVGERVLNPDQPLVLADGQDHVVTLAGSLRLQVRPVVQRTRQESGVQIARAALPGGIDSDRIHDAVIIKRPDNRSDMLAAMVMRRITIGPGYADLPLTDWDADSVELAICAGRWMIRQAGDAWRIVTDQDDIFGFVCRPGTYDDF